MKLCYNKRYIDYSEQGVFDWRYLNWIEKLELARLEMSWSSEVYLTNKYQNPDLFKYLKSLGTFKWKNLKYKLQYKFTNKFINFSHKDIQLDILKKILGLDERKEIDFTYDTSTLKRILIFNLRLIQMDNNRELINNLDIELKWFKDALILAPYWSIRYLDFIVDKYIRYKNNEDNLIDLIFDNYDE